jgi:hypothetical protein
MDVIVNLKPTEFADVVRHAVGPEVMAPSERRDHLEPETDRIRYPLAADCADKTP